MIPLFAFVANLAIDWAFLRLVNLSTSFTGERFLCLLVMCFPIAPLDFPGGFLESYIKSCTSRSS